MFCVGVDPRLMSSPTDLVRAVYEAINAGQPARMVITNELTD